MKALTFCRAAMLAVILPGMILCSVCAPPALAGCPVEAQKDAQKALKTEKKLKLLLGAGGSDGLEQVILKDPGTVTTIAPGSGLEQPRPWTIQEKRTLDKARVDKSLPAPEGVW